VTVVIRPRRHLRDCGHSHHPPRASPASSSVLAAVQTRAALPGWWPGWRHRSHRPAAADMARGARTTLVPHSDTAGAHIARVVAGSLTASHASLAAAPHARVLPCASPVYRPHPPCRLGSLSWAVHARGRRSTDGYFARAVQQRWHERGGTACGWGNRDSSRRGGGGRQWVGGQPGWAARSLHQLAPQQGLVLWPRGRGGATAAQGRG